MMPSFKKTQMKVVMKEGYAALGATLLIIAFSVAIIGGLTSFAFREIRVNAAFMKSLETRAIADAGVEDAVYRIVGNKTVAASQSILVGDGSTAVTVMPLGRQRIVTSRATRDNFEQNTEALVDIDTAGVFVYGVQIGAGGLLMRNSAVINGSVYSNGPIRIYDHGSTNPAITGDAFAAGQSMIEAPQGSLKIGGNAQAHLIQWTGSGGGEMRIEGDASSTTRIYKVVVGKDASADIFEASTVNQNAYYTTSISADTTVLGQRIQKPEPPQDLRLLDMPVSDLQLDQWEVEAQKGGEYNSPCPLVVKNATVSRGPLKINCDVTIRTNGTLNVQGTLWITKKLIFEEDGKIQLDSTSYGSKSGVIIVDNPTDRINDGYIRLNSKSSIWGSGGEFGAPGSYVMMVSRNAAAEAGLSGAEGAITIQEQSKGNVIYYAPHGKIVARNGIDVREITAYELNLYDQAAVNYQYGLSDIKFSTGPTGGYVIRYWKEIE